MRTAPVSVDTTKGRATETRNGAAINITVSGNASLNLNGLNYAGHGSVTTTAPTVTGTTAKVRFWRSGVFWAAVAALAAAASAMAAIAALK